MRNSERRPIDFFREEARPQWGDRIRNQLYIRRLWRIEPKIESVEEFERLLRLTSRTVGLKTALPDEEELLDLLKKDDSTIPEAVARKVKDSDDLPGYINFFIRSVQNSKEDIIVRINSALLLGKLGQPSPQAVNALLSALTDGSALVRARGTKALGELGDSSPKVISALSSALKDENLGVRWCAAEALGISGQPSSEIINTLISARKDEDWIVRGTVLWALGKLGRSTPQVISTVTEALKDEDYLVRWNATEALGLLDEVSSVVIKGLISALKDKHPHVRDGAGAALVELGQSSPEEVAKMLQEELSKEQDVDVKEKIRSIITNITKTQRQ